MFSLLILNVILVNQNVTLSGTGQEVISTSETQRLHDTTDEGKFILEVHRILYDITHLFYRDTNRKEKAEMKLLKFWENQYKTFPPGSCGSPHIQLLWSALCSRNGSSVKWCEHVKPLR